jgi:hypothetical protein
MPASLAREMGGVACKLVTRGWRSFLRSLRATAELGWGVESPDGRRLAFSCSSEEGNPCATGGIHGAARAVSWRSAPTPRNPRSSRPPPGLTRGLIWAAPGGPCSDRSLHRRPWGPGLEIDEGTLLPPPAARSQGSGGARGGNSGKRPHLPRSARRSSDLEGVSTAATICGGGVGGLSSRNYAGAPSASAARRRRGSMAEPSFRSRRSTKRRSAGLTGEGETPLRRHGDPAGISRRFTTDQRKYLSWELDRPAPSPPTAGLGLGHLGRRASLGYALSPPGVELPPRGADRGPECAATLSCSNWPAQARRAGSTPLPDQSPWISLCCG